LLRRFSARAPPYRVLFVLGGFGRRDGLLDIFERQIELIRIELPRALTELHASQLLQQMLQAVILRQCLVALGNRRVPLGHRRREPRLQRCDIGWKLICALAHARHGIRFARGCDP